MCTNLPDQPSEQRRRLKAPLQNRAQQKTHMADLFPQNLLVVLKVTWRVWAPVKGSSLFFSNKEHLH